MAILSLEMAVSASGAEPAATTRPEGGPPPAPARVVGPVLLWPTTAPEARGHQDRDKPAVTVYLPAGGGERRAAVVICPGGGYATLMMSYEGRDVARWLNAHGVVGVVLRYRVKPYRHPAPMLDGRRAMRLVRSRAGEWGVDPARIGMMGFSAGGHVASTVGTHFDGGDASAADPVERAGCRPDFLLLIYPVITMGRQGHAGSRANLLGPDPAAADVERLSNEKHVSADTPPTFLAHARTDRSVPAANSAMFYAALRANHVPAEFFELPEGGHGLGCGRGPLWSAWQARCLAWLRARGIVDQ